MKCTACKYEGGNDLPPFSIVGNTHITDRHPTLYACPKCGTVKIEVKE